MASDYLESVLHLSLTTGGALDRNVRKLLMASEALQSNLTCMVCTEMLEEAVTLSPCGHNICRSAS
eukprot:1780171-Rhodomonas_salina.2